MRKNYSCNNNNGLDSLIRILMGFSGIVAFPDIKAGIQMVLEDILLQEQFPSTCLLNNRDHSQSFHVMRNLFTITKYDKRTKDIIILGEYEFSNISPLFLLLLSLFSLIECKK